MWNTRASVIRPALLFLLILLLSPCVSVAQYRIESWTIDNGLPQNTVRSIVQTRDGYLWFTTYDGLVRFDGINFRVFDKSNTKGLTTNRFTCLYEDKDGTLWAGTGDGGVARYRDGAFISYPVAGQVYEFRYDLNGELLICSDSGQFYLRDDKIVRAPPEYQDHNRKLYLSPSGAQWTITAGKAREVRHGRVIEYPLKLGTPAIAVGLYEDRQQNLWLTDQSGIYRLRDGQTTHYLEKDGWPAQTSGRAWCEDDEGGVWFAIWSPATSNAAVRFKDGRFTVFGESLGLNNFTVNSIFKDREGVIWLGTAGGLHRLIKQVVTAYSTANGLLSNEVYPIVQTHNGDIWIGSISGLSQFRDGQFRNTRLAVPYPVVQALAEDNAGRLWIGIGGGLLLSDKGKFSDLSSLVEKATVSTILMDRFNNVWVGCERGLFKFNGEQVAAHYTSRNGLPADDVTAIHQDRDGSLWIGTPNALTQLKDGQFTSYAMAQGTARNIRAIYEDNDGTFWIGTYDDGLYRFRNGRVFHYTINDGLFSNGVFQILEDARGYFWITCNRGIYRLNRRELNDFADGETERINSVAYGKQDGMLNLECNGGRAPAGIIARDGKFWFPTMGGVVVIDPEAVSINTQVPPVHIESVTLERAPVDFQRGVTIEPGQQGLEISYTGLSYIKSDQIKFKHKLVGLDADWVDVSTRRVAYFPYLPPGTYTFRVIAANSDGIWNNEGASLVVIVRAPFWQHLWFRLLCAFVFLGLAGLAIRIRLVRLEQRHAEREAFSRRLIESQENERKRIASELHDSLGQNLLIVKNWALVGLNTLTDDNPAREHLNEISETTSLALNEVRQIAHNLRPYKLERLGLTKTIEYMVQQVRNSSDIEFITQIDNIDGLLSKEHEINLYRVVQECTNNILKHSAATNAWLSIKRTGSGAEISCRDDGKGFDAEAGLRKGGMGLIDMSERVRMLGGRYMIESALGKGCTIRVIIDSKRQGNAGD